MASAATLALAQAAGVRNRAAANAIAVQRLRQVADGAGFGQTQAQVVVGRLVDAGVVAANRTVGFGAKQAEVVGHEFDQHPLRGIRRAETRAEPQHGIVLVDLEVLRIGHAQRGRGLHECQHRGQCLRLQQVVGVEHTEEVAARLRQRLCQCDRVAVVAAIAQQAETRVAARVGGGDLAAAIGRAVVPQQAFPVRVGLRQQAVQRRRQEARGVVDGDCDADQRQSHVTVVLLEAGGGGPTSPVPTEKTMDPSQNPHVFHATTIVSVRRNGQVVIAGDGQVTLGHTVMKANARKVRRLGKDGQVLAGFAGAAADAFTLFELFEAKLEKHGGQLLRAAVEFAKDWRTERRFGKLEALLALADAQTSLIISGTGDVIEPEDGLIAIGSGGMYALSAARALLAHTEMDAKSIATEALNIAGDICIYTNRNIVVETL